MVTRCPHCNNVTQRSLWGTLGYATGWILLEILEKAF